jgi:hypothetical protein
MEQNILTAPIDYSIAIDIDSLLRYSRAELGSLFVKKADNKKRKEKKACALRQSAHNGVVRREPEIFRV